VTLPHSAVLYVDDDPRNLHAFRLAFKEHFRLLVAGNAQEALEVLEREPVAVLLADQRMPGVTGAELASEVRRRFPDVIRMIVTAYSDLGAVMDAINKGEVVRYFIKPWREEQMIDAIRAGIEAYQLTTVARDLQTRLLQQEQQATTTVILGRVLHELVSPAVGIRDNLGFLLDSVAQLARMAAAGDPDVVRVASGLVPAVEDALGSAEELVERVERFRQGEPMIPADGGGAGASLERAVQAAAGIVRPRARERARLVLDMADKPLARADATQLGQIVVNLLVNACEAIAPGHPERNQITVTTLAKGDRCVLVVEDTGGGITPELKDRLFEPFVSSKRPASGASSGRGLGLAIVKQIVENLGGKIEAAPAPRGTRFYVELPSA
jgi:two-component system, NtrC family, sensor kinase